MYAPSAFLLLFIVVLSWHDSSAVVVSKQPTEPDKDNNIAADTRVGYIPYQYQENVDVTRGAEVPSQNGPIDNQDPGLHVAGSAAALAAQFQHEMAAEHAVQQPQGKQHHVEYVTYQYEGHHEQHDSRPEQLQHPEVNQHNNGFGGYGLPVPVPVPVAVPVGHHEPQPLPHHHHDLPHHHHDLRYHHHDRGQNNLGHHDLGHHNLGHHDLGHNDLGHHHHHHHGNNKVSLQLKRVLIPLAGIALLGAAAALATNPVLLQLGVVSGKRRRRSSSGADKVSDEELDEMLQTTTPDYATEDEESRTKGRDVFGNLTKLAEQENEINVRMREIQVLEQFLNEQKKEESERRSVSTGTADGALASLLTCSGLLNTHSALCLQRMACEAYSDESELQALELQVIKIVLHELLVHNGIPEAVKLRLRAAVTAGIAGHRCEASYHCPPNAWSRCTNPAPDIYRSVGVKP